MKNVNGLYYDLHDVHQVQMDALAIDSQIMIGHRQDFSVELDDDEA